MHTPNPRLQEKLDSRRDFLRVTTVLAGSATLSPIDPGGGAIAAEDEQPKSAKDGAVSPKPITIRGHHLFDMLEAIGSGKSSHKTLGPVARKIRANPKAPLKIVVGVDDICAPCEWWDHEKSLCTKSLKKYPRDNQNSLTSDKNAIRVLGLKPGDVMDVDDVYRLIEARVTKKVFAEKVCVACRLVDRCKEKYEPRIKAAVSALAQPRSSG